MSKIVINKTAYSCGKSLFYLSCLSGLVWQSSQILVNYFGYGVVSDIKLLLPEHDNVQLYLHFCYGMGTVVNIRKLSLYSRDKIPSDWEHKFNFERYNLTLRDQFQIENNGLVVPFNSNTTAYIRLQHICFQFNSDTDVEHEISIPSKNLGKDSYYIFFQLGRKLPNLDPQRVLTYPHDPNPTYSISIDIGAYSLYAHRLKYPYTDDCIDFAMYKFPNRHTALYCCNIVRENETRLHKNRIVIENDSKLLDYKVSHDASVQDKCRRYDKDACNEHSTFTQILSSGKYPKIDYAVYSFTLRPSTHPSLRIFSHPNIGTIELITYILGAMGSWIGFSFLQLNPMKMFTTQGYSDIKKANVDREVKNLKETVVKLANDVTRLKMYQRWK